MFPRRYSEPLCLRANLILLLLLCGALPLRAQDAPPSNRAAVAARSARHPDVERFRVQVERTLEAGPAGKSFWGVLVADADTGETLYELNADRYFRPASVTKLFTTALALSKLGPAYRFRTTIESTGTLDPNGRLRGDLVLVGRGDPTLSNRKFPYAEKLEHEGPPEKALAEMADAVVAKGVRQVEGDVVADDSYFSYERFPPGWGIDDIKFGFGAAISAIAVNDNTFSIEVRPGERTGAPAWLDVTPWAGYYTIVNEITTGPPGSKMKLDLPWEPDSRDVHLRGLMPLQAEPPLLLLAIPQPAEYAAALLTRLLEERGVRVYGQARARHASAAVDLLASANASAVLAERVSPPLSEIIRMTNKTSQNLYAEMLLRAVARAETGTGSLEAGLKVEEDFLKAAGIAEGEFYFTDGSGLSRSNLVTPRAVITLLRYTVRQPWGEDLLSSLPVAAKDGTLIDQMKDTPAAGRIRAKTGSLEHAKGMAGFATTRAGTHLVFAMFGDDYAMHGRDAGAVLDAVAVAMVEEIGASSRKGGCPNCPK
jgi:D-alanyl-D-alanine carboxypeptidase/D-alanyl-D-alanine-endopeptidase (penicillin-binding protein 4)